MRNKIRLGAAVLALSALPVLAQERRSEAPSSSSGSARSELRFFETQEPAVRDERPRIQVLKHPYDIASFYRSPGGARGFSYGFGYSDGYGSRGYRSDSGLPARWYRPDLRGFGERRDDGWRLERRRSEDRPRPAPSRP